MGTELAQCTRCDSHGGMQINVTLGNGLKIGEGGSLEDRFLTYEIFAQWWKLPVLVDDDPYVGMEC